MFAEDGLKCTVDNRGFARARHTGHDGECAERKGEIYIFEIMACGTVYHNAFSVAFAAHCRSGYLLGTVEIAGGDSIGFKHLGRRALKDYISAFTPCSRTDIDNIVGLKHYVLVVLHYNNSIRGIAQTLER